MKTNKPYIASKPQGSESETNRAQQEQYPLTKVPIRHPMKKYIKVTVIETKRAVIYAELPEGKTASEIQDILAGAGIDWQHFEKDGETTDLDTTVEDFTPSDEIPYLAEWNRLHETEGE